MSYNFSSEKNLKLKEERGISFEAIIAALDGGLLLDVIDNPNHNKYHNQKIMVVNINNYVYLVPYIEEEHQVFLKIIFPSRKFTKVYLGEMKHESKT